MMEFKLFKDLDLLGVSKGVGGVWKDFYLALFGCHMLLGLWSTPQISLTSKVLLYLKAAKTTSQYIILNYFQSINFLGLPSLIVCLD